MGIWGTSRKPFPFHTLKDFFSGQGREFLSWMVSLTPAFKQLAVISRPNPLHSNAKTLVEPSSVRAVAVAKRRE